MATAPEFYSNDTLDANTSPASLGHIDDSHHGGEDVTVTDITPNEHEVNVDESSSPEGLSRLPETEMKAIVDNRTTEILTTSKEYREKLEVGSDVVTLLQARENHFETTNSSGETEVDRNTLKKCADAMFGKSRGSRGEKFSTRVRKLSEEVVKQNRNSLKWIVRDLPRTTTSIAEQEKFLTDLLTDAILLTAVEGTKTDVHRLINDLSEGKITWKSDRDVPSHTRRLIGSMAQLNNNEYRAGSTTTKLSIRDEFLLGSVPGNRGLDGNPYRTYIHGSIARKVIEDANNYGLDPDVQASLGKSNTDTTFCIYSEFIENGQYSEETPSGGRISKAISSRYLIGEESGQSGSSIIKTNEWKPSSRRSADRSRQMYKGFRNILEDYETSSRLDGFVDKFDERANVNKMSEVLLTLGQVAETANNPDTREGYKDFKDIDFSNKLDYIDTELGDRILAHTDLENPKIKEVLIRDLITDIENNIASLTDDEDKMTPWNTLWSTELFVAKENLEGGDLSKSLELLGQLAVFSKDTQIADKSRQALETMFVADLISMNGSTDLHDIVIDPSRSLEEIVDTLQALPDGDLLRERAELLFDRIQNLDEFRALYLKPNRTPEEEQKLNSLISMIRENGSNIFNDTVNLDENRSAFEASSESDLTDLDFVERLQLNSIKTVLGAKSDQEAREILALNSEGQILQNHGKRWMKILNKFKGRAAVLGLGVASTALALSAPALAPVAGAVGLGLLGIQVVNTGIRIAKNAKSFVKKSGGVGNAVKNLWKGIKTSAREAWKSVKENPVEFIIGGVIPTAIRVGVNVAAPGWGRIAGAGVEVGMGLIAESRLSGKKKELAEKLTALRALTEGFNPKDVEITDASGATRTVQIKPGMAYREYIDQKAKLRIGMNNGDINITDPTTGNPITWDEIKDNEDEIFNHIQAHNPPSSDHDYARYEVVKDTIEKAKEIKTVEDKYLKGVAKWNSALAGAAVFGIVDRVTNFTERTSEGIRDRFITSDGPTNAPPPTEEPTTEESPTEQPPTNDEPPIEQPPVAPPETPSQEGILVQDGRVNLEESAWHNNLGGEPQGNLSGGVTNHSNFAGGTHEMAPFLLENDLQELGVTRQNLLDTLGTRGVHQLLNDYHSQVYSGAKNVDIIEALKKMGEQGQALLDTVNN
jgi:hypothetical protein